MPVIIGGTEHRGRPAGLAFAVGLLLGAAWLGLLGCRQSPAAPPARKLAAVPTTRPAAVEAFLNVDGVKIHYSVEGTGEPVVLIHGLYSSIEMNWRWPGTLAAIAKDHQVIALDLPGHGASDKPEDASAYGAQMAEDVFFHFQERWSNEVNAYILIFTQQIGERANRSALRQVSHHGDSQTVNRADLFMDGVEIQQSLRGMLTSPVSRVNNRNA